MIIIEVMEEVALVMALAVLSLLRKRDIKEFIKMLRLDLSDFDHIYYLMLIDMLASLNT